MNKMIVDQVWQSKLNDVSGEVELCNEDGQTFGFFVPAESRKRSYDWAKSQFTRDELERASQEEGGRSLAEIMADLERK